MKKLNLEKIKDYISKEPLESKIYIGTDSTSRKTASGKWVADFYPVVVMHKNGGNGCKIFWDISTGENFNTNKKMFNHKYAP